MKLKGSKPEIKEKRVKMLIYGTYGTGKTMTSIQFPQPYIIDTEKGCENKQYIDEIIKNDGAVFNTCDFSEVLEEVRLLGSVEHNYKTLIIDSLSNLNMMLLDFYGEKLERENKKGYGASGKYGLVKSKMIGLYVLLLRLDMNVIVTAHLKNKYDGDMKIVGETFDASDAFGYFCELILKFEKTINNKRLFFVDKSRVNGFTGGEKHELSFEKIKEKFGSEYNLNKKCEPKELATNNQLNEIESLLRKVENSDLMVARWLDKSQSYELKDMQKDDIQKCINFLKSKISKKE